MYKVELPTIDSRFRLLFMLIPVVALLISAPVEASLMITAGNVISNSPSSTNELEINLTNTGSASLSLAGFSFEIETTDSRVTLTSATTATVLPYLFAGNSLFGPIINISEGQMLEASDFSVAAGGITVAGGATVGLGHVLFDIAAGDSSRSVAVTLSPFPFTSLSDPSGESISVVTLMSGSITIAGSPVPEPSALMLAFLGLAALASIRTRFEVR
jgi:PEP-CTERM motif